MLIEEIDFSVSDKQYRKLLTEIRDSMLGRLGQELVNITINGDRKMDNTPLNVALEFHIHGRENQDDFGPCLTVRYQNYNPASTSHTVTPDKLYLMAELARASHETIFSCRLITLDLESKYLTTELRMAQEELAEYLRKQEKVLVELVKKKYR